MQEARANLESDGIKAPICPTCQSSMLLNRIVPDRADHEMRTFKCPRCEDEIFELVKYRDIASNGG